MNFQTIPNNIIEKALDKLPPLNSTQNEYISILVLEEWDISKRKITDIHSTKRYKCIFKKDYGNKAWQLISIE